jgi:hypothetical protein
MLINSRMTSRMRVLKVLKFYDKNSSKGKTSVADPDSIRMNKMVSKRGIN